MRHIVLIVAGFVVAGVAGAVSLAAVARAAPPRLAATCQDHDGDGYGPGCAKGPDCNDADPRIHPDQAERCDHRDDNCNGLVDDSPACAVPPLDPAPVQVPASRFLMGSAEGEGAADERPRHGVQVGAFSLDRYEVTNVRFQACVRAGKCKAPALTSSHLRANYFENPEFNDYPVIFVDWSQANAFCSFAGGRLPTEAEWELAARGPEPSTRTFPWGNEPPDCSKANMGGSGSCVGDTDRVGRRPDGASVFGAHDMAGNVWEWVADWYDASYYAKAPGSNPTGPKSGTLKVMRGGCWVSGADSLRVSCRKAELPTTWAYNVGFRCAFPGGK